MVTPTTPPLYQRHRTFYNFPLLVFFNADLVVHLSTNERDTLFLHTWVVSAYSTWFESRLKPYWSIEPGGYTSKIGVTNVSEARVYSLVRFEEDSNCCLSAQGVDHALPWNDFHHHLDGCEGPNFASHFLSPLPPHLEWLNPDCTIYSHVQSHVDFFLLLYDFSDFVSLDWLPPQVKTWTRTPYLDRTSPVPTNTSELRLSPFTPRQEMFLRFADIASLADFYGALPLVAPLLEVKLYTIEGILAFAAKEPEVCLVLAVLLQDVEMYDEAIRHAVGKARAWKCHPLDWQVDTYTRKEMGQMLFRPNYAQQGLEKAIPWTLDRACFESEEQRPIEELYPFTDIPHLSHIEFPSRVAHLRGQHRSLLHSLLKFFITIRRDQFPRCTSMAGLFRTELQTQHRIDNLTQAFCRALIVHSPGAELNDESILWITRCFLEQLFHHIKAMISNFLESARSARFEPPVPPDISSLIGHLFPYCPDLPFSESTTDSVDRPQAHQYHSEKIPFESYSTNFKHNMGHTPWLRPPIWYHTAVEIVVWHQQPLLLFLCTPQSKLTPLGTPWQSHTSLMVRLRPPPRRGQPREDYGPVLSPLANHSHISLYPSPGQQRSELLLVPLMGAHSGQWCGTGSWNGFSAKFWTNEFKLRPIVWGDKEELATYSVRLAVDVWQRSFYPSSPLLGNGYGISGINLVAPLDKMNLDPCYAQV
ncbi:MAG: hypothetical protein M1814_004091 [Vezdaea aestivalis]|nr:MAG: hypothetical protein M1814_004091 [Vezdaea aestivalis]